MFDRPWPPSTATQAPVTQDARGESRKTATFATSSAVPNRPIGMFSATKRAIPSGSSCWRRHQVPPGWLMEPGAPGFTRIPSGASRRPPPRRKERRGERLLPHVVRVAGGGEVDRVHEGVDAAEPLGRGRDEPLRVFGAQQGAGDGQPPP